MLLQDSPKALPSLAEVYANGGRARPKDPGDLLRRIAGVIVEDQGGPLVRREAREPGDQSGRRLSHLVARVEHLCLEPPTVLQFPSGDPKRRPPDPSLWVAEVLSTTKGLGERLGHGIACHLPVPGEGHEGAPQTSTVLPIQTLQPALSPH
jgi:hypothetical protein